MSVVLISLENLISTKTGSKGVKKKPEWIGKRDFAISFFLFYSYKKLI